MSLRTTVLRLTVFLCCWLRTHHSVFALNVTVDDTDPSIVYSPAESWFSSGSLCSTCLNPGISTSYHEGIHPDTNHDADDFTSTSSSSTPTASLPAPPTSSPSTTQDSGRPSNDFSDKGNRAVERRLVRPRLDNDDAGFVDTPVTLSYNFTGSDIYLFCIQPLAAATVGGTPTNMNLTLTLDNQPSGNYFSMGTPGVQGFQNHVVSLNGLSNTPHQLVVNIGDNSVFIFDYLIYTDNSVPNSTFSTLPAATSIQTTPTKANIKDHKKNDIATFGGALGGSVGVLSLCALGLAISIIRRRTLAARRDRLDNEANAAGDTTSMSGPVPFVPRYFPDTIIPPDPPTYDDALSSTNHNNTPSLLASLTSTAYPSRQRSYADIPPASPPPPLEELPPPPPFPSSLSAPKPDLPPLPSLSGVNQTSGSPDPLNNGSPNFTSCERAPLLQSSNSDMRPHSRMSTTSSLESRENSEANHHQEDDASSEGSHASSADIYV